MTGPGSTDRTFIAWLQEADAPTLPERVYEAAFAEARRTVRSRRRPWPFGTMVVADHPKLQLRTALGLAALAVVLIGYALVLVARQPPPPEQRIYRGIFEPAGRISRDDDPPRLSTLTELPDGSVLLTDGDDLRRFDPATGTFSQVGTMAVSRMGETATSLADGRVLIVGGGKDREMHVPRPPEGWRAEVYEPATGTVSQTGSTNEPRGDGAATRLGDGRVLITGGTGQGPTLASAEIYDPWTGRFMQTGPMTQARSMHDAILLRDGRVLVVGGGGATAELYDPASGRFTATGPMLVVQQDFQTVVLPDGQVLFVGGYVPGPRADDQVVSEIVQMYDPLSGRFRLIDPLPGPRAQHVAVAIDDGRILVVGGVTGRGGGGEWGLGQALDDRYYYDPVTGRSTPTGSMSVPRRNALGITLRDGRVLIASHRPMNLERVPWGDEARRSAEVFERARGTFEASGLAH